MNKLKIECLCIIFFSCITWLSNAQCGTDFPSYKAIPFLDDYRVNKNYSFYINGRFKKKKEFTTVLNRERAYRFVLFSRDGEAEGLNVIVSNHKREIIASSYQNERYLQVFDFQIKETGIYYFTAHYQKGYSNCGGGTLAVKKLKE